MRTADKLRERALAFATMGWSDDEAVSELVEAAAGRRVAIVIARQELEHMSESANPETASRAASLLDRALSAGVWPDALSE